MKAGGWLASNRWRVYAAKGNGTGEFYGYEPFEDDWDTLSPVPSGESGRLFKRGSKGVGDGRQFIYSTKGSTPEFWRYNATDDSWDLMASIPGKPFQAKVKDGADLVYVDVGDTGYVYLLKGYKNEFWRYNTAAGNWRKLADAPGEKRWKSGSWLASDGVGSVYAHKGACGEFYRYDVASDTWDIRQLRPIPLVGRTGKTKKAKNGSCGAFMDDSIYALKGSNTGEIWQYSVAADSWYELETLPQVGHTGKRKRVSVGADIVACPSLGALYALKGNGTCEFWRYYLWGFEFEGQAARVQRNPPPWLHITPNPVSGRHFQVTTTLPNTGQVRLSIYDALGRCRVSKFVNGGKTAGLDAEQLGLSPGIYIVRLDAPGYSATAKFTTTR